MSDTAWLICISVVAVGVASMTIRRLAKQRGRDLVLYIAAIIFAAALGWLIAVEAASGPVSLGIVIGIAGVELGATLSLAARGIIRARGKGFEKRVALRTGSTRGKEDEK